MSSTTWTFTYQGWPGNSHGWMTALPKADKSLRPISHHCLESPDNILLLLEYLFWLHICLFVNVRFLPKQPIVYSLHTLSWYYKELTSQPDKCERWAMLWSPLVLLCSAPLWCNWPDRKMKWPLEDFVPVPIKCQQPRGLVEGSLEDCIHLDKHPIYGIIFPISRTHRSSIKGWKRKVTFTVTPSDQVGKFLFPDPLRSADLEVWFQRQKHLYQEPPQHIILNWKFRFPHDHFGLLIPLSQ